MEDTSYLKFKNYVKDNIEELDGRVDTLEENVLTLDKEKQSERYVYYKLEERIAKLEGLKRNEKTEISSDEDCLSCDYLRMLLNKEVNKNDDIRKIIETRY